MTCCKPTLATPTTRKKSAPCRASARAARNAARTAGTRLEREPLASARQVATVATAPEHELMARPHAHAVLVIFTRRPIPEGFPLIGPRVVASAVSGQ